MLDHVEELLLAAIEGGSANTLSCSQIREWLSGYLVGREEEVRAFPSEAGESHWDLIAADFDSRRDALFFVAVFDGEYVDLTSGRGDGSAVRIFAEDDFPDKPMDVIPELARRFGLLGAPVTVPLADLLRWVNNS